MSLTGLKRNSESEKYYTKPEIVGVCVDKIREQNFIQPHDLLIEPSAGNGSFIEPIKSLSDRVKFYDLNPEHPEIQQQDFLTLDITRTLSEGSARVESRTLSVHFIGNPPFGRQSSLAIKFVKKCCVFGKSISFILPKSFKKESLKKHFSSYFHCILEWDLPINSFLVNGIEYDVPSVFQVWIKKDIEREKTLKYEPIGFSFVKKNENPDFAFRRVGSNAGKFDKIILNKNESSHYFLKFDEDKNINELNSIQFETNNTVGPKSISKQELIIALRKIR